MAKTITFNFEGTEYTLEFTRASVATLEKQGFNINDISDKPLTTLPALFTGAFIAHHRFVKREVVDRIFDKMTNKKDLVMRLAEMYNETIESLVDEPEESEGNLEWGASW
jgi:hypothetical protein